MFKTKILLIIYLLFYCFFIKLTATDDNYYADQWNLDIISIQDAWNITTGSTSIKIAIFKPSRSWRPGRFTPESI